LYNIDDLQAIADDYLRLREDEIAKCNAIIKVKADELLEAFQVLPVICRQSPPFPPAGNTSATQS